MRAGGLSAAVFFALTVPVAIAAPYAAEILWFLAFPLTRITFAWFLVEKNHQPGEGERT
jgi:mannose/fructose/N-acetylgalactosamine-specific phosphotransferase system component IID